MRFQRGSSRATDLALQGSAAALMALRRLPEPVFRVCTGLVNFVCIGKEARRLGQRCIWIFKIQHTIRVQTGERRIITEIAYDPVARAIL